MSSVPNGPLPRGRHGLSVQEVRDSQRHRIVHAMIDLVGEHGYAATTVPAVIARAQVSRNAFYSLFDNKADCFVAVCDLYTDELLERMYTFVSAPTWLEALDRGMTTYLEWWQRNPAFAATYFVELPQAGPAAVDRRDGHFARFGELFAALAAWARHADPSLPALAPRAPQLLVSGLTEIIAVEVRGGRLGELDGLRAELAALAVTLLAARR